MSHHPHSEEYAGTEARQYPRPHPVSKFSFGRFIFNLIRRGVCLIIWAFWFADVVIMSGSAIDNYQRQSTSKSENWGWIYDYTIASRYYAKPIFFFVALILIYKIWPYKEEIEAEGWVPEEQKRTAFVWKLAIVVAIPTVFLITGALFIYLTFPSGPLNR